MNSGKFFFENGNVKKKPHGFVNRILTGVRWSGRHSRAQQPDDLVRLARIHLAEDFPNSEREDCPARSILSAIIESQELPSDDVREHLLVCSECFVYYREELARRRGTKLTELMGGKSAIRIPKLASILAGSLATLLLAALVFLIVNDRSEGTGGKANLNSAPTKEAGDSNARSAMPEQSPQVALQPEPPASLDRNNARSLVVQNRVSIDFEAYNSLRSAGPSPQLQPVLLRRTQNQLTIKLPAASPRGRYRVNLADPYGGAVQSVEAISRDGTQLRLKLNLSSVKPGDYLICLTRESEVPQCIPSIVGKK